MPSRAFLVCLLATHVYGDLELATNAASQLVVLSASTPVKLNVGSVELVQCLQDRIPVGCNVSETDSAAAIEAREQTIIFPANVVINDVPLLERLDSLAAYRASLNSTCQPYRLASDQYSEPLLVTHRDQLHVYARELMLNHQSWFAQIKTASEIICDVCYSRSIDPCMSLGGVQLDVTCADRQLPVIPCLPTDVVALNLSNNPLEVVTLAKLDPLTQLQSLILDNTGLKSLPPQIFQSLLRLDELSAQHNQLSDWSVVNTSSFATRLKTLRLSHNTLTNLGTEPLASLKILDISYNLDLETLLDVWVPPVLEELYADYCHLTTLPIMFNSSLSKLSAEGNFLTHLPVNLSSLSALTQLNLASNRLSEFPAALAGSALSKLAFLSLANNTISGLPDRLGQLTRLYQLNLMQNQLSSFNFGPMPLLREIDLRVNHITTLPVFRHWPQLRIMKLGTNNISELAPQTFTNMTLLHTLRLNGNRLTSFEAEQIAGCHNLRFLYLHNNNLTNITGAHFNSMTQLEILRLGYNRLTVLPEVTFEGLSSLQELFLAGNQLSDLNNGLFGSLTNMTQLFLDNNRLTRISSQLFGQTTRLQTLSLDFNQISTIGPSAFESLINLQSLTLRDNPLELDSGVFSELTSLQRLVLRNCSLTTMSGDIFGALSQLHTLYLQDNAITELPLESFQELTSLKDLVLQPNSFACCPNSDTSQVFALPHIARLVKAEAYCNPVLSKCSLGS
eukprot:m.122672 g.122672  ORF g.122672 m.122672 type:complete len:734 (+) comp15656_c0_seq4:69-2270(+)